MVSARSEVLHASSTVEDERCVTLEEALAFGAHHDGVVPTLSLLRELRDNPDLEHVNVRVGDQAITVGNSGCIPEHSKISYEKRLVVVPCPEDVAKRCGNCVMNLANGAEIIASMHPANPLHIQHD